MGACSSNPGANDTGDGVDAHPAQMCQSPEELEIDEIERAVSRTWDKKKRPLAMGRDEEIQEVFDSFDKDKSGSIDKNEMAAILRSFGKTATDEELQMMISRLDTETKNGKIEFSEFKKAMVEHLGTSLEFLFVVCDSEEALFLQPVVESLALLEALANGGDHPQNKPYTFSLEGCGLTTPALDGKEDPTNEQVLSEEDLEKLRTKWKFVRVVVAGVAHRMQAQIAGAWKGSHVVGVLDKFASWSTDLLAVKYFVGEGGVAKEMLVPSPLQADKLKKDHPDVEVTAVGSPALEGSRMIAGNVGVVRAVMNEVYGAQPGVLLVGERGEGHAPALRIFCEAVAQLPDFRFAYAPHPGLGPEDVKADVDIMNTVLQEHGIESNPVVVLTDMFVSQGNTRIKVNTRLVTAASFVTVSNYSTMGGQSAYIGVPHIFVDGPHPCQNSIFKGIIPVVKDAAALKEKVLEYHGSSAVDPVKFNRVMPGLNKNASLRMVHHLLQVSAAQHGEASLSLARPDVGAVLQSEAASVASNVLLRLLGDVQY
eukprot:CAMPEP_0179186908 /NCGR_PEP_ID=MMETSP0796-20121207/92720_1 /TAXON_ID=73915 /ORGANISM="Pyrodinium bahamense, Strain pbaha01" /LENGTH=537 /DNA_ID=CAMNT_0020890929 /DNA_START=80 /DNA_END=1692 /DNA_ORIENTATION=+